MSVLFAIVYFISLRSFSPLPASRATEEESRGVKDYSRTEKEE